MDTQFSYTMHIYFNIWQTYMLDVLLGLPAYPLEPVNTNKNTNQKYIK